MLKLMVSGCLKWAALGLLFVVSGRIFAVGFIKIKKLVKEGDRV